MSDHTPSSAELFASGAMGGGNRHSGSSIPSGGPVGNKGMAALSKDISATFKTDGMDSLLSFGDALGEVTSQVAGAVNFTAISSVSDLKYGVGDAGDPSKILGGFETHEAGKTLGFSANVNLKNPNPTGIGGQVGHAA